MTNQIGNNLVDFIKEREKQSDVLEKRIKEAKDEFYKFWREHVVEVNRLLEGKSFYLTGPILPHEKRLRLDHQRVTDLVAVKSYDSRFTPKPVMPILRIECKDADFPHVTYRFFVTKSIIIEPA